MGLKGAMEVLARMCTTAHTGGRRRHLRRLPVLAWMLLLVLHACSEAAPVHDGGEELVDLDDGALPAKKTILMPDGTAQATTPAADVQKAQAKKAAASIVDQNFESYALKTSADSRIIGKERKVDAIVNKGLRQFAALPEKQRMIAAEKYKKQRAIAVENERTAKQNMVKERKEKDETLRDHVDNTAMEKSRKTRYVDEKVLFSHYAKARHEQARTASGQYAQAKIKERLSEELVRKLKEKKAEEMQRIAGIRKKQTSISTRANRKKESLKAAEKQLKHADRMIERRKKAAIRAQRKVSKARARAGRD